jgi:hypothetical protein
MVGQPSHVKQLSLNHVCKIGLKNSTEFYFHENELHNLQGVSDFLIYVFISKIQF